MTDQFVIRASAAKVMVRPNGGGQAGGLLLLRFGGYQPRSQQRGRPAIRCWIRIAPRRADLLLEWYFAEDSPLSLALFQKDIDSFVQILRAAPATSRTMRWACRIPRRDRRLRHDHSKSQRVPPG